MAVDACPLSVRQVREGLSRIEPSDSWLRHRVVESVLDWPDGSIAAFHTSIVRRQEGQGSTARASRTHLSAIQTALEGDGFFFLRDLVAVTRPKARRPSLVS